MVTSVAVSPENLDFTGGLKIENFGGGPKRRSPYEKSVPYMFQGGVPRPAKISGRRPEGGLKTNISH